MGVRRVDFAGRGGGGVTSDGAGCSHVRLAHAGTQFTWFTSRKVQILTRLQLGVHFRGADVLVDKDRECGACTVSAKVYICMYIRM